MMYSSFTYLALLTAASVGLTGAIPAPPPPAQSPAPEPTPGGDAEGAECGELNVFLTGLAPYHPLVISQGFDPAVIDETLRADHQRIIDAGYNSRFTLFGPEVSLDDLRTAISEPHFHGVGVGAGVRASVVPELVIRLEEIIQVFREETELDVPIYFNWNSTSTSVALERTLPLREDCKAAGKAGKDLGFQVICDESVCQTPA